MRVSGLTINLPARDSEGERVCAREREQAGGAVGEARGGDRRARAGAGGPETAVCPRDAQMERDKERPRQREASRGRLTDRSGGDPGTDFSSEECPKRKPSGKPCFLFSFS